MVEEGQSVSAHGGDWREHARAGTPCWLCRGVLLVPGHPLEQRPAADWGFTVSADTCPAAVTADGQEDVFVTWEDGRRSLLRLPGPWSRTLTSRRRGVWNPEIPTTPPNTDRNVNTGQLCKTVAWLAAALWSRTMEAMHLIVR